MYWEPRLGKLVAVAFASLHATTCLWLLAVSVDFAAAQPNVVMFLVDDLGYADNTVLGPSPSYYETPNLERLAHRGVTFSNASASPVCSPTRSALMTGKNPARTTITDWISGAGGTAYNLKQPSDWDKTLNSSEVTVAEALKGAGYSTAHFGKWHLGTSGSTGADPLQHGFDVNIGGNRAGSPPGGYFAGSDGGWSAPGLQNLGLSSDAYLTDVLTDFATDYIKDQVASPTGQPFYMQLNHYAVHGPLAAPQSLVSKYQNKTSPVSGQSNATYAAMIEKVDDSLGRVLDTLEDPNGDGDTSDSITDNTIVIFYSDNGGVKGTTNNVPFSAGKGGLAEGGLRVPLVVSWPANGDISQDVSTDGMVAQEDFYTTILDMTGVPGDATHNAETDGVSFLPVLEGGESGRDTVFYHYPHRHGSFSSGNRYSAFASAVRDGHWKLVYQYGTDDWDLFDLSSDPGELNDLSEVNVAKYAELRNELVQWFIDIDAQMPLNATTNVPLDRPDFLTEIPGDLTGDGQIDEADWVLLNGDLGTRVVDGETVGSDLNQDMRVDFKDFLQFKTIFDNVHGEGALETLIESVPEPSTSMLLVLGGVLFSLLRRPRKRGDSPFSR